MSKKGRLTMHLLTVKTFFPLVWAIQVRGKRKGMVGRWSMTQKFF